jgi:hypothetical protein
MRLEWISGSAAALIIGSFSLVLGFLLNPLSQEQSIGESLRGPGQVTDQWVASSSSLFIASVGMTLGIPALMSLLVGRFRLLAVLAAMVFSVGTIGTSGYGFVMLAMRALVAHDAVVIDRLEKATHDAGFVAFLAVWLGCFLLGLVLLAAGLLAAATVPRWVPVLMLVFVASQFLPDVGGDLGTVIQFLVLAIALTGAAMAAHTRVVEKSSTPSLPR